MITASDLTVLRQFIASQAEVFSKWAARCAALLGEYERLDQQFNTLAKEAASSWTSDHTPTHELAPRGRPIWA